MRSCAKRKKVQRVQRECKEGQCKEVQRGTCLFLHIMNIKTKHSKKGMFKTRKGFLNEVLFEFLQKIACFFASKTNSY